MKYKVGDKVKIREDLVDGKRYGDESFIGSMTQYMGKIATIKCCKGHIGYIIDIDKDKFIWTDEMFEDIEPNIATYTKYNGMTVADLLNKTDVEYGGLIIAIYYPNAYFETTIGHNKINRNSELYKRFIKAYGDMIVDEIGFDIRNGNMVVMRIKVDYAD